MHFFSHDNHIEVEKQLHKQNIEYIVKEVLVFCLPFSMCFCLPVSIFLELFLYLKDNSVTKVTRIKSTRYLELEVNTEPRQTSYLTHCWQIPRAVSYAVQVPSSTRQIPNK